MLDKIKKSLDYGALDHKWLVREYLWEKQQKQQQQQQQASQNDGKERQVGQIDDEVDDQDTFLYEIAVSAFNYYMDHIDIIKSDPSLKAITELCSDEILTLHTEHSDSQVFHLSNTFNHIIESNRRLHKCYDCGTNARAMFLKLIEVNRGNKYLTHQEQQQMKDEYKVTYDNVLETIDTCYQRLKESKQDIVLILSISVQKFGHVWVLEKKWLNLGAGHTIPRYHHYQSSLRSHLLLDFIESKDYGKNLHQSLDIDRFFRDLKKLMNKHDAWEESDYRLFVNMFAFIPVSKVNDPRPGFCFTSITY